ncbi:thiamine diphosphate-binding protein [Hymenopellis radicata]|nr:thiamine diphosphate-binding protein [Hymenopellis radicata]
MAGPRLVLVSRVGHNSHRGLWCRTYHNPNCGIVAGYLEIEFPDIEATTGPLGQGIANAVGLAIASKRLPATYNKPGLDIIDNKIWRVTGSANGFHAINVQDGTNDLPAIIAALDTAKGVIGKPVFIHIRTVIGFGSRRANTGAAHGRALEADEVEYVKGSGVWMPRLSDSGRSLRYVGYSLFFKDDEAAWNTLYAKYANAHPEEYAELHQRLTGKLPEEWRTFLPPKLKLPTAEQPTRKSSGIALAAPVPKYKHSIAGSADLLESTFVNFPGQVEFQAPETGLGDYSGRQIRYGIREFSMIGLANGMSAYQNGMFIAICSTFFMFWLYAAPGARMTALQIRSASPLTIRLVSVKTGLLISLSHSRLANFYRGLPNYNFIRPADAEECMGAWEVALDFDDTPSLTIRTLPPTRPHPRRLRPEASTQRSFSMPSQSHFHQQPFAFLDSVLRNGRALIVAMGLVILWMATRMRLHVVRYLRCVRTTSRKRYPRG